MFAYWLVSLFELPACDPRIETVCDVLSANAVVKAPPIHPVPITTIFSTLLLLGLVVLRRFRDQGRLAGMTYELRDRIACEGEVEAKLGWLVPFICRAKAYRQSRCCIRRGRRCLPRSSRHAIRAEGSVP